VSEENGIMSEKTALIVGASRGLGLALVEEYLKRGWRVVATVRGGGRAALRELDNDRLEIETVDIAEQDRIAALRSRLAGRRFDLLFVNAGVANDPDEHIGDVSTEEFVRVMVTNALGPMRVVEALVDLVPPGGAVGVMSSSLGSIASNQSGRWEVYRGSKSALNMYMRCFSIRNGNDSRTYLIMDPGWVRTDMGGSTATLSIEESIPGVVDTISAQSGKPGLQYLNYQGRTLPW
jgi:NAD(P)-dependent dehydrogenase (short-subunit alcohol dehydrogenase family)